jgi:hypothetical protein
MSYNDCMNRSDDDRLKLDHQLGNIKVYIDPVIAKDPNAPIKMGYKGITQWNDKVQADMIALLATIDYDILTETEKNAYKHFQFCISEWKLGRNPTEQGFFYCPYFPWSIIDRTDIWEDDGGSVVSDAVFPAFPFRMKTRIHGKI